MDPLYSPPPEYTALWRLLHEGPAREWWKHALEQSSLTIKDIVRDPPEPSEVAAAAHAVLEHYCRKNPAYADSWARRGTQGVFHNVARKFDRIEHRVLRGHEPDTDDVVDLAVYALLQFAWHLVQHPDAVRAWADQQGLIP